jgi:hypothetical protein
MRPGVNPHFAYDANYLIDKKVGIIIDAEGTRANRIEEIAVTQTMLARVERRFGLRPQRLAGDTVYGAVTSRQVCDLSRLQILCRCGSRIPRYQLTVLMAE